MAFDRAPTYEIVLDYQPLVDGIEEFCACGKKNYHDVAQLANVAFPKVLHLMAGKDANLYGHETVSLMRLVDLPLSALVSWRGDAR